MKPAGLTQKIHDSLNSLRKSERKVAEFVLGDLTRVIHLRIVDLAHEAEVSEPTVMRFCHALGYSGFQDFKLSLAQQLAFSPSFGQIAVTDKDSIADFSHKVFDSTVDTLLNVRDSLDPARIDEAISAICAATRVEFFGFGASGAVAVDAQHRFFRLQIPSAAHSDQHIQNMAAMALAPGDVVIAMSQSGRTKALLHSMALAKKNGGVVIALAPSNTPVIKEASIPIVVDVEEAIEMYTPLSSRIAHLVVIDVLAIGVTQRKGASLKDHLYKVMLGLQELRLNPEED